jgi:hypothetical protein
MAATTASSLVARSKRMRLNDPIRIEVGSDSNHENYTINSEILTRRSLLFRKALSGGFKEATERVVKLPEDDPEIFGNYLHHVLTNELCVLPDLLVLEGNGYEEKTVLIKLYVLAEKLQDTKSKNAIVRGLITSCCQKRSDGGAYFFNPKLATLLYKGTVSGSMARKVLVEMKAYDSVNTEILSKEGWPYEFLTELACELIQHLDTNDNKKQKFWRMDHPEDYMEKETED